MFKRVKELLQRLPPERLEPLEIRESILDQIEEDLVEPMGDGRRRLCSLIKVTLLSADPEQRNRLRSALTGGGGLKQRIVARCTAEHVEVPASLDVQIEDASVPDSAADFRIEGWTGDSRDVQRQPPAIARLTVLSTGYTIDISSNVFRIGREQQPKDRAGRSKPANHLYFGELETSVSRQHATIRFDPATAEYRLWDAGSTRGTKIIRDDAEIDIPRTLRARGELLRDGDVIYLGKAGVLFHLISHPDESGGD